MQRYIQKINYLIDSIFRFNEKPRCPFCGTLEYKVIDRKYYFTKLLSCNSCNLYYRFPVEKLGKSELYYQDNYIEQDGITSIMPTSDELLYFQKFNFIIGSKNADRYIKLFNKLIPGKPSDIKIIDYGSSWGYISFQLKNHGFDTQSFEISKPRAYFGNKNLFLDIKTDHNEIRLNNDIFFSSHVIEHHPDIASMIAIAKKTLKNGGYFIAVSPNGSDEYRYNDPIGFHSSWGKVHPNYINAEFYKEIFKNYSYYIASSPFDSIDLNLWRNKYQVIGNLSSEELIVIVQF
jgi:hypothetical protein